MTCLLAPCPPVVVITWPTLLGSPSVTRPSKTCTACWARPVSRRRGSKGDCATTLGAACTLGWRLAWWRGADRHVAGPHPTLQGPKALAAGLPTAAPPAAHVPGEALPPATSPASHARRAACARTGSFPSRCSGLSRSSFSVCGSVSRAPVPWFTNWLVPGPCGAAARRAARVGAGRLLPCAPGQARGHRWAVPAALPAAHLEHCVGWAPCRQPGPAGLAGAPRWWAVRRWGDLGRAACRAGRTPVPTSLGWSLCRFWALSCAGSGAGLLSEESARPSC